MKQQFWSFSIIVALILVVTVFATARHAPAQTGKNIDIAITNVEVSKREASRGDMIELKVTIRNKGDRSRNILTIRALHGKKILASQTVNLGMADWGVKDEITASLSWDTSKTEPGSYTVKIEAPLPEDSYAFDNYYDIQGDIVIR